MFESLKILQYPEPCLKRASDQVTTFDERLTALSKRMFELMREAKGVGLAAAQVGENIRMFVMNPTGGPDDDREHADILKIGRAHV